MSTHETAISYDLDGVLFPRPPMQLEAVRFWSYNTPLIPKHSAILRNDRTPIHRALSRGERAEVKRHIPRIVKPEMIPIVRAMNARLKVGNTGRPNYTEMVNLTNSRLSESGLLGKEIEYVLFKPDGVSSDESKFWGIIELQSLGFEVTHYDDNARTVKRLASALPNAKFVVVQDLTSDLLFSRIEMEQCPNVARVGIRKSGQIDIVYQGRQFGDFPHAI